MSSISERSCSLLVHNEKPASYNEIKEALEGSDPEAKTTAMKKAVMAILNGEQLPALFITIVRYVLPSEDHGIQKLLLLYLASILTERTPCKSMQRLTGASAMKICMGCS